MKNFKEFSNEGFGEKLGNTVKRIGKDVKNYFYDIEEEEEEEKRIEEEKRKKEVQDKNRREFKKRYSYYC